ncbi:carboxypeptidase-like regulatory domain-containing protein [Halorussus caseinilyticus]|uniref:Carboxypeptidase regulatory-like domain-containing protein n=1 Tax=Halorussus caseinilyticus TaxID=3034025 RepID=A0ABD5WS31_9EURY
MNLSASTDFGDYRLGEGHVVDVRVVDANGDPVENANVTLGHNRFGVSSGWRNDTNANGYFSQFGRRGMELSGNVTVDVTPPENSTRFAERLYTRNLDVTNDTTVTVTLDPNRVNFTARIAESDGTSAVGDTVGFKELPRRPVRGATPTRPADSRSNSAATPATNWSTIRTTCATTRTSRSPTTGRPTSTRWASTTPRTSGTSTSNCRTPRTSTSPSRRSPARPSRTRRSTSGTTALATPSRCTACRPTPTG